MSSPENRAAARAVVLAGAPVEAATWRTIFEIHDDPATRIGRFTADWETNVTSGAVTGDDLINLGVRMQFIAGHGPGGEAPDHVEDMVIDGALADDSRPALRDRRDHRGLRGRRRSAPRVSRAAACRARGAGLCGPAARGLILGGRAVSPAAPRACASTPPRSARR